MTFVLWSSHNHTSTKYRCSIKRSKQTAPTLPYTMQELQTAIPQLFTHCTEQVSSRMTAHSRIMKPFCPKSWMLPRCSFVQSIVFMIPKTTLQEQTNQQENRPLVTDSPVEFEESLVEVQDFRKITDHFREIYGIYLKLMERIRNERF